MLQIAICDDEKKDLLHMRTLVEEVMDHFSVRYDIQNFDTGEELLDSGLSFDLIFIDIKLNGEDGIEIGKKIYWKNRNVKVIFQTNFSEECVNAVNKSHAFAFLTKPVEKELLKNQIEEFLRTREGIQNMWVTFSNTKWIYPTKGEEQHTTRIPVRDIIYLEGIKNDSFIKVTTKNGVFLYQSEFPELEEKFRLFGFGICSRGIMVNFEKVREMKTQELILKNGEKLPLSRRRSVDFREKMAEFFYSSMGGWNV